VQLNDGDVRRAHERLGRADEIVGQRRTLYAFAVELGAEGRGAPFADPGPDVLDNPMVRGHLGEVLGGRSALAPDRLQPITELVAPGFATEVAGYAVRLASTPAAAAALAGAVERIGEELERHGDEDSGLRVLTVEDPGAERAWTTLVAGVELAARVAPFLARDLLAHVSLFAVAVPTDSSARLGSASAREYPGLVLIPTPRSPLEVAEALVHEGAHQKLFDLCTTRAMLGPLSVTAPRFEPSWAADRVTDWPLEQALAAWHAYRCLDVFSRALETAGGGVQIHDDSLLPKAAARAREIGDWLRGRGPFLGPDAHILIAALDGVGPSEGSRDVEDPTALERAIGGAGSRLRPAGSRTLVARPGVPPELFWIDSALVETRA
jgi:hypothetical protein